MSKLAKYIHLMNGKPAYFDGRMIMFADDGIDLDALLVNSKHELDTQLIASRRWVYERKANDEYEYSYLRVRV